MFKDYGKLGTLLYEATKPIGFSVNGDIEYYSQRLRGLDQTILEAGVGTGRMLIPFLKDGYKIDGIDNSPEMLKQCRINMEKSGVTTSLYEQDLTDMSLQDKYGAIIMPTGSFCLLPKDRIENVLDSFYRHLVDDGMLMFDIEMPMDFRKGEVTTFTKGLTDNSGILLTTYSQSIDWYTQKVQYLLKYELLKDGEVKETEVSQIVLYWYGITELILLLDKAGFRDIQHNRGYGKDDESSLITFIAIRGT